jgi:NAD(P)H dehydrogenase (quinone)
MSLEPVRHLVVLSHPRQDSFNHQVATTYCDAVREAGQVASLRDLYALRFDPVLEIIPEAPQRAVLYDVAEIGKCDIVTFIYPVWFGLPPAMIKGYIDRVFGTGFTPAPDHIRANDKFLAGKRMLSFSTSASTQTWYSEHGHVPALLDIYDQYLASIFGLADTSHVHIDAVVKGLTDDYAEEQLALVRRTALSTCAALAMAAAKTPTTKARQRLSIKA